jgi:alpha/beta superfamily hydrolase
VFAFDFTGSGRSDGEFITLGINESKDMEAVIKYLRYN